MGQGEVAEDEFWEGLQSLGLGRDLSRSHVSRIVKSFKASGTRNRRWEASTRGLCAKLTCCLVVEGGREWKHARYPAIS